MVNIDTVYQRVLAIANKEQRGYVTPQEFNLLANQAQLTIFEEYFMLMAQAQAAIGNDTEYSDIINTLNEKISIFKKLSSDLTYSNGYFAYPSDMYKLGTLYYNHNGVSTHNGVEVQEINHNELQDYYQSPLTTPTISRPLYIKTSSGIEVFSSTAITTNVKASYIKKPSKAEWGYVVTNGQALYNAGSSENFELHASEESVLVMKILELAGIVINKPELVTVGQQKQ